MIDLENKKWKEFKISDLFEIYKLSSNAMYKKNYLKGQIPLITRKKDDNGIKKFIEVDYSKTFKNAITVSNLGDVLFHEYRFYPICPFCLKNKEFSKYVMQFICIIISKNFKNKYSFTNNLTQEKLKKETILLPVTEDGCLDIEFMENYIINIYKKMQKKLNFFNNSFL